MISKRVAARKDGKSSASDSLKYGEGLKKNLETGELLDKSHRTRLGNFGLVDDGVYVDHDPFEMEKIINRASIEMQANCDQNSRVGWDKKLAHFVVSFNQERPSEAALLDTENSMLLALGLDNNHFSTFLHSDNGHWHLHIFASQIEKIAPHRGNPLWQDKTKRDKVCREVEKRHGLVRDNGMHRIDEIGNVVEVPKAERRAKREEKGQGISDKARVMEIYSGEKSFQSWCNEIRIGDRLKPAKNWAEMHAIAAAYGLEVKAKGAGFVIVPEGQKGGIQLGKIGLKNMTAKFGEFEPSNGSQNGIKKEATYKPGPVVKEGKTAYATWAVLQAEHRANRTTQINEQRETHAKAREALREAHKIELTALRKRAAKGQDKFAAVSLAKMTQVSAMEQLKEQFATEREALRRELAKAAPGNTFRDYLQRKAGQGDNESLGLARRYGEQEATEVLRLREASQLKIVAVIKGKEYRPAPRLNFTHQVERNGTVVYDFGHGRKVTDSAVSRQVQLNDAAAHSPEAIATALAFATTKFGNTLTLSGPPAFVRLAVETAVLKHPGIRFSDPALEAHRAQLAAAQQATRRPKFGPDLAHLTPQQINNGIQNVLNRTPRPPAHIIARNAAARVTDDLIRAQQHRPQHEAEEGSGLHELPAGRVDGEGQNLGVLLPNALHDSLGNRQTGHDHDVRRAGAVARRTDGANTSTENTIDTSTSLGAGAGANRPELQRGNAIIRTAIDRNQEVQDVTNRVPVTAPIQQPEPGEAVLLDPIATPDKTVTAEELPTQTTAEIDYLADIYKQLEVAKEIASQYSPLHNPAAQATDESHSQHIQSRILASNDQYIAVIVGKQVQILKLEILNKNVEYEGHAEGVDRFAVGNEVSIAPQRDGSIKTVVSETREAMQTEATREREKGQGI